MPTRYLLSILYLGISLFSAAICYEIFVSPELIRINIANQVKPIKFRKAEDHHLTTPINSSPLTILKEAQAKGHIYLTALNSEQPKSIEASFLSNFTSATQVIKRVLAASYYECSQLTLERKKGNALLTTHLCCERNDA